VGVIVGKGGKTLYDIQYNTGATITVAAKDELIPGTKNRLVTITGHAHATQDAHALVLKKIEYALSHPAQ
jgi:RNA-binding protein Nova